MCVFVFQFAATSAVVRGCVNFLSTCNKRKNDDAVGENKNDSERKQSAY